MNVKPEQIDSLRSELRLLAQLDLDPAMQGKVDLSGVIQHTVLEACQAVATYRGSTEAELMGWMRRILANNLKDEIRKLQRVGHDVRLDVSIHRSSIRLDGILEADQTPPDVRAERNEELLRLTRAMLRLPDDQRYAVLRHHLQNLPVAVVADEMQRSREAVAGLIHRGIVRLREELSL